MSMKPPAIMIFIGLGTMGVGIISSKALGTEISLMAMMMGFIMILSGLMLGYRGSFKDKAKTQRDFEDENQGLLRIIGAFGAFISLVVPYIKIPLAKNVERSAYSAVDIAIAIQNGQSVEGGFILLLFMGVVIAGSFIALFHHVGGYIILLGGAGFTYLLMETLNYTDVMTVIRSEFQIGLYAVGICSIIIIVSPFLRSDTEMTAGRDMPWFK